MTAIQLLNIALLKIGVSKGIEALDETSREAYTGALIYDHHLRAALRSYPWAFATKYLALTVVQGPDPPANGDWAYAYRWPTDCITARRIVPPGTGRTFNDAPIRFRVGRDPDGLLIYTHEPEAELEYTTIDCTALWSDDLFLDCFTWRLAAALSPSLSKIPKMTETCLAMYEHTRDIAAAISRAEEQQDPPGEAEAIRAR